MKSIVAFAFTIFMLAAYVKLDVQYSNNGNKKKNKCHVMNIELLPKKAEDNFARKYPDTSVDIWLNKDDEGFCAIFKYKGNKRCAYFNNYGSFIKEEIIQDNATTYTSKHKDCSCNIE